MLLIDARIQVSQIYSANMFENYHVSGHRELPYGGRRRKLSGCGQSHWGLRSSCLCTLEPQNVGRAPEEAGSKLTREGQMNQVLRWS